MEIRLKPSSHSPCSGFPYLKYALSPVVDANNRCSLWVCGVARKFLRNIGKGSDIKESEARDGDLRGCYGSKTASVLLLRHPSPHHGKTHEEQQRPQLLPHDHPGPLLVLRQADDGHPPPEPARRHVPRQVTGPTLFPLCVKYMDHSILLHVIQF
ncbi:hypothetical protein AVEN_104784-1 [Araneus ventricosus]|uniref:Uncharacterized protein n=1 Tax=Araneus ventricosus TaxID=182803 RepID=A0A4Y2TGS4_ARAVE|nr:hypothetical protein AVEN_104784-1 [Araneus ventricosus]